MSWLGLGFPDYLLDAVGQFLAGAKACSADGQIVYGSLELRFDDDPVVYLQPGFVRLDGTSDYLGPIQLSMEAAFGWPYAMTWTRADDSLATGAYTSPEMRGRLPNGGDAFGGLIWTSGHGACIAARIFAELGAGAGLAFNACGFRFGQWALFVADHR